MELTCALVLVIVGIVSASPHGYGTKGGATAKADAHAVAGAYTNARSIPLSIPSGAGYSGSFSQSSSSASSSASSSSSSFSYSGSGSVVPGGTSGGVNGCGSGNCNGGGAKGSAAATLAGGYGSNLPTSSYGHKYDSGESQANKAQGCGSEGCQGTNYSGSLVENGADVGSQSTSDAKAAASAGAGYPTGSDCKGLNCNSLPGTDIKCTSGQCGFNAKCSSGNCGASSQTGSPTENNEPGKTCTSGQCTSNQDVGSSNDIHVPTSGSSYSKPNYDASTSGCSNGDCRLSAPESQTGSSYNKPATDLTAPKLEPPCSGLDCQTSQSGYSSPSCSGGSCSYSATGQTQVPYVSSNNQNIKQISQAPTSSYGGFSKFPAGSSGGNTGLPSAPSAFGVVPGTTPPSYTGNIEITAGTSAQKDVKENLPAYTGGFGGPAGVLNPNEFNTPASSYGSIPAAIEPVAASHGGFLKPSYSHGSSNYSPVKPSGPACVPGAPDCVVTSSPTSSDCASGSCGVIPSASGYGSPSTDKSSYSFGSSPSYSSANPVGSICNPGTPGCAPSPSVNSPSGCTSGNCGAFSSSTGYGGSSNITPGYPHENSHLYSSVNTVGSACTPGTSGCAAPPSVNGPSGCISGNCGAYPSSPGYGGASSNTPGYPHSSSPSFSSVKPLGTNCAPGTPGCGAVPEYVGSSNIKPSYSPVIPLSPACTPGTPGCVSSPSAGVPSGCSTENCGIYPTSAGYGDSSQENSPSFSPVKPVGPASGYDSSFNIKPSYSHGSSASYSPMNPSSCTPGTPGCMSSAIGYGGSVGIKPSYAQGNSPSHFPLKPPGSACTPGIPGCTSSPSINIPSNCVSGNCDNPSVTVYDGSSSIKPIYSQGSSYFPGKPSGPGCAPGTPGCNTLASAGDSLDCASGNCGSDSSLPQGCSPGTPGCSGLPSNIHAGIAGFPSTQTTTVTHGPSYGASGAGSSLNKPSYGSHGTGSIQTSYNKPTSTEFPSGSSGSGAYTPGFPPTPSAPGAVPAIGSPSYTGNIGTTAVSSQQGTKEKRPTYNGGFGGPSGILKPNEFTAPTSSYGNKPTLTAIPSIAKPACTSGICDAQASPSHSQSGAAYGAQATAGASASANAVVYTGGFGGPPGFLQPYDGGKIDLKGPTGKQLQGSLLNSQHEIGGSGIHSSYSNGESQISGSTIAQANAAAISTTGVSDGGNNHEHNSSGGCGGGCSGSGSSSLGYNGATAGGVAAKSVATASSGARAYGGSYSSSSASAHAGASVKGGYGRR